MTTNQFIYTTPSRNNRITIKIQNTEYAEDYIEITPTPSQHYFEYTCKGSIPVLLPLLKKLEEANINASSSFENIINFLYDNNIKYGIHTIIPYGKQRGLSTIITVKEIVKRKLKRDNITSKLLISQKLQLSLLLEIKKIQDIYPEFLANEKELNDEIEKYQPGNNMNNFQFRAECETDVTRLKKLLPNATFEIEYPAKDLPCVVVTLTTNCHIELVRYYMNSIRDGHVMAETLATVNEYNGERTFNN